MKYLLDTNVVSEWIKPRPNPKLVQWLHEADEEELFLSVITWAELRYGIERLQNGKRKSQLEAWLSEDLASRFEGRVLAVDEAVADRWGKVVSRSESTGKRAAAMDGFLAATAEAHGLLLVTRDVAAFAGLLSDFYNPWAS